MSQVDPKTLAGPAFVSRDGKTVTVKVECPSDNAAILLMEQFEADVWIHVEELLMIEGSKHFYYIPMDEETRMSRARAAAHLKAFAGPFAQFPPAEAAQPKPLVAESHPATPDPYVQEFDPGDLVRGVHGDGTVVRSLSAGMVEVRYGKFPGLLYAHRSDELKLIMVAAVQEMKIGTIKSAARAELSERFAADVRGRQARWWEFWR